MNGRVHDEKLSTDSIRRAEPAGIEQGSTMSIQRTMPLAAAILFLGGCVTDYTYRSGNGGDYYHGTPRTEYRYYGPDGVYRSYSPYVPYWYGGYGGYGNQQELNRGYQQGIETGSSDAERRQSYDPQRSKHWRNARTQEFREGFARGYDEGYRRYGYNNNGRYGNNSGIGIADILGGILGRP